jgi:hypothetical protein
MALLNSDISVPYLALVIAKHYAHHVLCHPVPFHSQSVSVMGLFKNKASPSSQWLIIEDDPDEPGRSEPPRQNCCVRAGTLINTFLCRDLLTLFFTVLQFFSGTFHASHYCCANERGDWNFGRRFKFKFCRCVLGGGNGTWNDGRAWIISA